MLNSFLTKMSKQEKMIAYFAFAAILLALLDRFIFSTILTKIRLIDDQIKLQELSLKKNSKIIAQKELIKKEDEQYAIYSVESKTQEEEISGVLKEIEMLASQSAINLVEIKPTDLKTEKILKRYSISLTCEATMEQLTNFMFLIDSSKVLFTIDNYSLVSKDREKGIVKCTMNISKVVVL